MDLTLLCRGPLSSCDCDYDCPYWPFAERRDTTAQLRADRASLERFTAWACERREDELSVLFTPWARGWSVPGTGALSWNSRLPDRPLLPLVPSELASTAAAVTGSPEL